MFPVLKCIILAAVLSVSPAHQFAQSADSFIPGIEHSHNKVTLLADATPTLALDSGPAMSATDGGPTVNAPAPAAEPDAVQLVAALFAVFTTYKSAGLVAALIAAVNLVVNLTKLSLFDPIFKTRWWLRPVVSVVTGVALASLGAVAAGTPLGAAVLAGLIAGLSGTGFHELISTFNPQLQAERAAGSHIVAAVKDGDADVKTRIEALKAHLDSISSIPDESARLKALAAFANGAPPTA